MSISSETLHKNLKDIFGFNSFKGKQEQIIQNLLQGNDSMVIMPTGGGKSMCYQLPALISDGIAIIISPLIALMKNQVDAIRTFNSKESIAHVLNSSLSKTQVNIVMEDIKSGETKMLYVAPESLIKEEYIEFFRSVKISFFAIDEAHCISEWGHDFRPEYRRIREIIENIGRKPIIALTATATPKVRHDIMKNLKCLDSTLFLDSFNRKNLFYDIRPKHDVEKEMIKFIREHPNKSGIVYCLSRKKVEEIAETLQVNGINARPYHAGLDQKTRISNQDAFIMDDCDIIVATIAFGMGIDKPDIRYVVHHDIPKSLEGYYQETGRAGRDGGKGDLITFYSYKDIEKLEKFLSGKPVSEQEIGRQLIMETISFAETAMCRRKYLLHYFGEEFDSENCDNMCDNCKNPKPTFEGQEFVLKLLNAIEVSKETFKAKELAKIMIGEANSLINQHMGIIIDIFYDHYLAKNWSDYSAMPLGVYVNSVYQLLTQQKQILPEKTLQMMPFMIQYNWLYNYQYKEGIKSVLNGMNRRTNNKGQIDLAIEDLYQLDEDFEKDFQLFFEDLRIFSHQKIKQLQQQNTQT